MISKLRIAVDNKVPDGIVFALAQEDCQQLARVRSTASEIIFCILDNPRNKSLVVMLEDSALIQKFNKCFCFVFGEINDFVVNKAELLFEEINHSSGSFKSFFSYLFVLFFNRTYFFGNSPEFS